MFTGIITDIGKVLSVEKKGDTTFIVEASYDMQYVALGASIACSGVCLTVTDKGTTDDGRGWFSVDASEETLSLTTARNWQAGTKLNLERALRMGDELGGHMVLGHVDCMAEVVEIEHEGDSLRFRFNVPAQYERFLASKGSIVLNGVSLTINEVEDTVFGVNIIPHTTDNTTFGTLKVGDKINLEIDALARYVARLMDKKV